MSRTGSLPGRCALCDGEEGSRLPTVDHITGEKFELVVCSRCGLGRTEPVPPDLLRYYQAGYYGSGGIRFNPLVEAAIHASRSSRVEAIIRAHPTTGAILDVGCGRGLMLAALAERGWRSIGTEISETVSRHAREVLGLDIRVGDLAGCHFPPASFDVVTFFHVLEHLPDPEAALAEARRVIGSEGRLLVEAPNLGGLQSTLAGGRAFQVDAPRHLFHFTRASLLRSLERAGFEALRVGTHSFEFGYFGMVQSLLNLATRRQNALYEMLKNRSARPRGALGADSAATIGLLLPAAIVGLPLEAAAAVAGRGAVLKVVARPR
jgi:2-polyprenyl-3-methyl-5-hydroxy-6-metoxy-1,4-benzoquinol methylase